MRFTTYSKYKGRWLDALNLESLLENLSDFLMDGGFAGGPNYHPYWGWSGDEERFDLEAGAASEARNALERSLAAGDDLLELERAARRAVGRYVNATTARRPVIVPVIRTVRP